jgi:hypothetical protein
VYERILPVTPKGGHIPKALRFGRDEQERVSTLHPSLDRTRTTLFDAVGVGYLFARSLTAPIKAAIRPEVLVVLNRLLWFVARHGRERHDGNRQPATTIVNGLSAIEWSAVGTSAITDVGGSRPRKRLSWRSNGHLSAPQSPQRCTAWRQSR